MEKILTKIEDYVLFVFLFLFPVLVLSISPNPFVIPKLILLVYALATIILLKSLKTISKGKLSFSTSKYDLAVLALAVSYLAASILRTPNKMEAFLLPGTATAIIGGAILFFVVNQVSNNTKHAAKSVLILSAVVFASLTLFSFAGIFAKIPQLPAYLKATGFTPEGGFLPGFVFLLSIFPLGLGLFMGEKDIAKKALWGVSLGILLFGITISAYNILPGMRFAPRFPSTSVSWEIAIDSLKQSPLLGVGPGNYVTAFNLFRPISFNTTDLWALKFSTASSFYLTLLTEAGMAGALSLGAIIFSFFKNTRKDIKAKRAVNWGFAGVAASVSLVFLIVLLALFPATPLIIVLFFVLLALQAETSQMSLNLSAKSDAGETNELASRVPAVLFALPVIIVVGFVIFQSSRYAIAEYRFKKSLDALVRNDAKETLEYLQSAIALNPRVDRYHATAARVYFALANAAAQKQDLTDADRQAILTFIQGSIQEGKATVALNPLRAGNWETLGRTYQAIIPFAEGADNFATQALRQAVALDPMNPTTRIALGGVYYARKDYENAARIFELAAISKQDYPNAYFNLAYAYKEKGEISKAVQAMSQVLALVDRNTQDYEVARKALEEMQAAQTELTKQATDNLTPPADEAEPVLDPKLELPEDATPPESPVSPTPTPTVEDF